MNFHPLKVFGSRFIPKNLQQHFMDAVKMINWGDTLSSEDICENSDLFISKINDTMSSFSRRGCLRNGKEHRLPWLNQLKINDALIKDPAVLANS